jgi:short-subunit dehydrogenase
VADKDPRALVTGASSGIGAAFALALRERGRKLVLVARREDRLRALAREMGEADVEVIPADLALPEAPGRLCEELARRDLEIDLLVNNAGSGRTGPFQGESRERLLAMVDLNVRAIVDLTHRLLPRMVERRRGAIVNVASNAAFQPIPYLAVYAATKSFVVSFTEGLSGELRGTGVRVQALCPGPTLTEFFEAAGQPPTLLASRLPRMSAEEVVGYSLRALDGGRTRVVPGLANRILAILVGFAPGKLVQRVAGALYRPR